MAVRPEIALGVQRPKLYGPGEILTLRDLAQQGEMRRMKMEDLQESRESRNALKGIYGQQGAFEESGLPTPQTIQQVGAVDPGQAQQLQGQRLKLLKTIAETEAAQARTRTAQLEAESKQQDLLNRLVRAPALAAYEAALPQGEEAAMRAGQSAYSQGLENAGRSGLFSVAQRGQFQTDFDSTRLRSRLSMSKEFIEGRKAALPQRTERISGETKIQEERDPITGQVREIGRGPRFSTKPLVTVETKAESEYAKKVGGKAAERDFGQQEAAENAVENAEKLQMVSKHIKESDAITGMGAEVMLNLERTKQFVMESEKSGKRISDTELLDSFLGSDVFPMIKALGIGARGLDTPAEREFLRKVMTGVITLNKETLSRMTQIRLDIAERAVRKWNKRVEGGELDEYFKLTKAPKKTLALPGGTPKRRTSDRDGALTPEEQAELDQLRKRFGIGR